MLETDDWNKALEIKYLKQSAWNKVLETDDWNKVLETDDWNKVFEIKYLE